MIRWQTLIIPILAGGLAAAFVSVNFWDLSKQAFLVSLSVIAAGVLVRLARGLPFTNVDHYEVEEIRDLTKAVDQICRSLRALIFVVLLAMVFLVLAKPVVEAAKLAQITAPYGERIVQISSGLLGFLIGYIFMRMVQVIQGDYDLTKLQSKFVVRAVERKQLKQFDGLDPKVGKAQFKNPEGYGKIIRNKKTD
jgi:hypothetical protein